MVMRGLTTIAEMALVAAAVACSPSVKVVGMSDYGIVPGADSLTERFASALREQAEAVVPPMPVVDFDNDAAFTAITPNVGLYAVENPLNDIFNIDIIFFNCFFVCWSKYHVDCIIIEHFFSIHFN